MESSVSSPIYNHNRSKFPPDSKSKMNNDLNFRNKPGSINDIQIKSTYEKESRFTSSSGELPPLGYFLLRNDTNTNYAAQNATIPIDVAPIFEPPSTPYWSPPSQVKPQPFVSSASQFYLGHSSHHPSTLFPSKHRNEFQFHHFRSGSHSLPHSTQEHAQHGWTQVVGEKHFSLFSEWNPSIYLIMRRPQQTNTTSPPPSFGTSFWDHAALIFTPQATSIFQSLDQIPGSSDIFHFLSPELSSRFVSPRLHRDNFEISSPLPSLTPDCTIISLPRALHIALMQESNSVMRTAAFLPTTHQDHVAQYMHHLPASFASLSSSTSSSPSSPSSSSSSSSPASASCSPHLADFVKNTFPLNQTQHSQSQELHPLLAMFDQTHGLSQSPLSSIVYRASFRPSDLRYASRPLPTFAPHMIIATMFKQRRTLQLRINHCILSLGIEYFLRWKLGPFGLVKLYFQPYLDYFPPEIIQLMERHQNGASLSIEDIELTVSNNENNSQEDINCVDMETFISAFSSLISTQTHLNLLQMIQNYLQISPTLQHLPFNLIATFQQQQQQQQQQQSKNDQTNTTNDNDITQLLHSLEQNDKTLKQANLSILERLGRLTQLQSHQLKSCSQAFQSSSTSFSSIHRKQQSIHSQTIWSCFHEYLKRDFPTLVATIASESSILPNPSSQNNLAPLPSSPLPSLNLSNALFQPLAHLTPPPIQCLESICEHVIPFIYFAYCHILHPSHLQYDHHASQRSAAIPNIPKTHFKQGHAQSLCYLDVSVFRSLFNSSSQLADSSPDHRVQLYSTSLSVHNSLDYLSIQSGHLTRRSPLYASLSSLSQSSLHHQNHSNRQYHTEHLKHDDEQPSHQTISSLEMFHSNPISSHHTMNNGRNDAINNKADAAAAAAVAAANSNLREIPLLTDLPTPSSPFWELLRDPYGTFIAPDVVYSAVNHGVGLQPGLYHEEVDTYPREEQSRKDAMLLATNKLYNEQVLEGDILIAPILRRSVQIGSKFPSTTDIKNRIAFPHHGFTPNSYDALLAEDIQIFRKSFVVQTEAHLNSFDFKTPHPVTPSTLQTACGLWDVPYIQTSVASLAQLQHLGLAESVQALSHLFHHSDFASRLGQSIASLSLISSASERPLSLYAPHQAPTDAKQAFQFGQGRADTKLELECNNELFHPIACSQLQRPVFHPRERLSRQPPEEEEHLVPLDIETPSSKKQSTNLNSNEQSIKSGHIACVLSHSSPDQHPELLTPDQILVCSDDYWSGVLGRYFSNIIMPSLCKIHSIKTNKIRNRVSTQEIPSMTSTQIAHESHNLHVSNQSSAHIATAMAWKQSPPCFLHFCAEPFFVQHPAIGSFRQIVDDSSPSQPRLGGTFKSHKVVNSFAHNTSHNFWDLNSGGPFASISFAMLSNLSPSVKSGLQRHTQQGPFSEDDDETQENEPHSALRSLSLFPILFKRYMIPGDSMLSAYQRWVHHLSPTALPCVAMKMWDIFNAGPFAIKYLLSQSLSTTPPSMGASTAFIPRPYTPEKSDLLNSNFSPTAIVNFSISSLMLRQKHKPVVITSFLDRFINLKQSFAYFFSWFNSNMASREHFDQALWESYAKTSHFNDIYDSYHFDRRVSLFENHSLPYTPALSSVPWLHAIPSSNASPSDTPSDDCTTDYFNTLCRMKPHTNNTKTQPGRAANSHSDSRPAYLPQLCGGVSSLNKALHTIRWCSMTSFSSNKVLQRCLYFQRVIKRNNVAKFLDLWNSGFSPFFHDNSGLMTLDYCSMMHLPTMSWAYFHLLYAHLSSMPLIGYIGAFDCHNNLYNQLQYNSNHTTALQQWVDMVDNDVSFLKSLHDTTLPSILQIFTAIVSQSYQFENNTSVPAYPQTAYADHSALPHIKSTLLVSLPHSTRSYIEAAIPIFSQLLSSLPGAIAMMRQLKRLACVIFSQTMSGLFTCGQLLTRWPNHHIVLELVHALHSVKDQIWELCDKQFSNVSQLCVQAMMCVPIEHVTRLLRDILIQPNLCTEEIIVNVSPSSLGPEGHETLSSSDLSPFSSHMTPLLTSYFPTRRATTLPSLLHECLYALFLPSQNGHSAHLPYPLPLSSATSDDHGVAISSIHSTCQHLLSANRSSLTIDQNENTLPFQNNVHLSDSSAHRPDNQSIPVKPPSFALPEQEHVNDRMLFAVQMASDRFPNPFPLAATQEMTPRHPSFYPRNIVVNNYLFQPVASLPDFLNVTCGDRFVYNYMIPKPPALALGTSEWNQLEQELRRQGYALDKHQCSDKSTKVHVFRCEHTAKPAIPIPPRADSHLYFPISALFSTSATSDTLLFDDIEHNSHQIQSFLNRVLGQTSNLADMQIPASNWEIRLETCFASGDTGKNPPSPYTNDHPNHGPCLIEAVYFARNIDQASISTAVLLDWIEKNTSRFSQGYASNHNHNVDDHDNNNNNNHNRNDDHSHSPHQIPPLSGLPSDPDIMDESLPLPIASNISVPSPIHDISTLPPSRDSISSTPQLPPPFQLYDMQLLFTILEHSRHSSHRPDAKQSHDLTRLINDLFPHLALIPSFSRKNRKENNRKENDGSEKKQLLSVEPDPSQPHIDQLCQGLKTNIPTVAAGRHISASQTSPEVFKAAPKPIYSFMNPWVAPIHSPLPSSYVLKSLSEQLYQSVGTMIRAEAVFTELAHQCNDIARSSRLEIPFPDCVKPPTPCSPVPIADNCSLSSTCPPVQRSTTTQSFQSCQPPGTLLDNSNTPTSTSHRDISSHPTPSAVSCDGQSGFITPNVAVTVSTSTPGSEHISPIYLMKSQSISVPFTKSHQLQHFPTALGILGNVQNSSRYHCWNSLALASTSLNMPHVMLLLQTGLVDVNMPGNGHTASVCALKAGQRAINAQLSRVEFPPSTLTSLASRLSSGVVDASTPLPKHSARRRSTSPQRRSAFLEEAGAFLPPAGFAPHFFASAQSFRTLSRPTESLRNINNPRDRLAIQKDLAKNTLGSSFWTSYRPSFGKDVVIQVLRLFLLSHCDTLTATHHENVQLDETTKSTKGNVCLNQSMRAHITRFVDNFSRYRSVLTSPLSPSCVLSQPSRAVVPPGSVSTISQFQEVLSNELDGPIATNPLFDDNRSSLPSFSLPSYLQFDSFSPLHTTPYLNCSYLHLPTVSINFKNCQAHYPGDHFVMERDPFEHSPADWFSRIFFISTQADFEYAAAAEQLAFQNIGPIHHFLPSLTSPQPHVASIEQHLNQFSTHLNWTLVDYAMMRINSQIDSLSTSATEYLLQQNNIVSIPFDPNIKSNCGADSSPSITVAFSSALSPNAVSKNPCPQSSIQALQFSISNRLDTFEYASPLLPNDIQSQYYSSSSHLDHFCDFFPPFPIFASNITLAELRKTCRAQYPWFYLLLQVVSSGYCFGLLTSSRRLHYLATQVHASTENSSAPQNRRLGFSRVVKYARLSTPSSPHAVDPYSFPDVKEFTNSSEQQHYVRQLRDLCERAPLQVLKESYLAILDGASTPRHRSIPETNNRKIAFHSKALLFIDMTSRDEICAGDTSHDPLIPFVSFFAAAAISMHLFPMSFQSPIAPHRGEHTAPAILRYPTPSYLLPCRYILPDYASDSISNPLHTILDPIMPAMLKTRASTLVQEVDHFVQHVCLALGKQIEHINGNDILGLIDQMAIAATASSSSFNDDLKFDSMSFNPMATQQETSSCSQLAISASSDEQTTKPNVEIYSFRLPSPIFSSIHLDWLSASLADLHDADISQLYTSIYRLPVTLLSPSSNSTNDQQHTTTQNNYTSSTRLYLLAQRSETDDDSSLINQNKQTVLPVVVSPLAAFSASHFRSAPTLMRQLGLPRDCSSIQLEQIVNFVNSPFARSACAKDWEKGVISALQDSITDACAHKSIDASKSLLTTYFSNLRQQLEHSFYPQFNLHDWYWKLTQSWQMLTEAPRQSHFDIATLLIAHPHTMIKLPLKILSSLDGNALFAIKAGLMFQGTQNAVRFRQLVNMWAHDADFAALSWRVFSCEQTHQTHTPSSQNPRWRPLSQLDAVPTHRSRSPPNYIPISSHQPAIISTTTIPLTATQTNNTSPEQPEIISLSSSSDQYPNQLPSTSPISSILPLPITVTDQLIPPFPQRRMHPIPSSSLSISNSMGSAIQPVHQQHSFNDLIDPVAIEHPTTEFSQSSFQHVNATAHETSPATASPQQHEASNLLSLQSSPQLTPTILNPSSPPSVHFLQTSARQHHSHESSRSNASINEVVLPQFTTPQPEPSYHLDNGVEKAAPNAFPIPRSLASLSDQTLCNMMTQRLEKFNCSHGAYLEQFNDSLSTRAQNVMSHTTPSSSLRDMPQPSPETVETMIMMLYANLSTSLLWTRHFAQTLPNQTNDESKNFSLPQYLYESTETAHMQQTIPIDGDEITQIIQSVHHTAVSKSSSSSAAAASHSFSLNQHSQSSFDSSSIFSSILLPTNFATTPNLRSDISHLPIFRDLFIVLCQIKPLYVFSKQCQAYLFTKRVCDFNSVHGTELSPMQLLDWHHNRVEAKNPSAQLHPFFRGYVSAIDPTLQLATGPTTFSQSTSNSNNGSPIHIDFSNLVTPHIQMTNLFQIQDGMLCPELYSRLFGVNQLLLFISMTRMENRAVSTFQRLYNKSLIESDQHHVLVSDSPPICTAATPTPADSHSPSTSFFSTPFGSFSHPKIPLQNDDARSDDKQIQQHTSSRIEFTYSQHIPERDDVLSQSTDALCRTISRYTQSSNNPLVLALICDAILSITTAAQRGNALSVSSSKRPFYVNNAQLRCFPSILTTDAELDTIIGRQQQYQRQEHLPHQFPTMGWNTFPSVSLTLQAYFQHLAIALNPSNEENRVLSHLLTSLHCNSVIHQQATPEHNLISSPNVSAGSASNFITPTPSASQSTSTLVASPLNTTWLSNCAISFPQLIHLLRVLYHRQERMSLHHVLCELLNVPSLTLKQPISKIASDLFPVSSSPLYSITMTSQLFSSPDHSSPDHSLLKLLSSTPLFQMSKMLSFSSPASSFMISPSCLHTLRAYITTRQLHSHHIPPTPAPFILRTVFQSILDARCAIFATALWNNISQVFKANSLPFPDEFQNPFHHVDINHNNDDFLVQNHESKSGVVFKPLSSSMASFSLAKPSAFETSQLQNKHSGQQIVETSREYTLDKVESHSIHYQWSNQMEDALKHYSGSSTTFFDLPPQLIQLVGEYAFTNDLMTDIDLSTGYILVKSPHCDAPKSNHQHSLPMHPHDTHQQSSNTLRETISHNLAPSIATFGTFAPGLFDIQNSIQYSALWPCAISFSKRHQCRCHCHCSLCSDDM